MDSSTEPLLEIENLCLSYYTRAGEIPAVVDFSLKLAPGETTQAAIPLPTGIFADGSMQKLGLKLESQSVALEGLQEALRQRKATPAEIARHAERGGVATVMRPYLEALTTHG